MTPRVQLEPIYRFSTVGLKVKLPNGEERVETDDNSASGLSGTVTMLKPRLAKVSVPVAHDPESSIAIIAALTGGALAKDPRVINVTPAVIIDSFFIKAEAFIGLIFLQVCIFTGNVLRVR
jgi:hypothetical protein